MKKSILKLGRALDKNQLKQINGGNVVLCGSQPACSDHHPMSYCLVLGPGHCFDPEDISYE